MDTIEKTNRQMTSAEHVRYAEKALDKAEEEFLKSEVEGEEVSHFEAAKVLIHLADVHVRLAQVKRDLSGDTQSPTL